MCTQITKYGWREVLVDIDHTPQTALRFVLAPSDTPASVIYSSLATTPGVEKGTWLEVCPQGLLCAQELAARVVQGGGAALVIDYGGGGANNSLRVSSNIYTCVWSECLHVNKETCMVMAMCLVLTQTL